MDISDYNALVGQFVIGRQKASVPPDWQQTSQGGWHLAAHPTTRIVTLLSPSGLSLGWLLGEPILGAKMVNGHLTVTTPSTVVLEEQLFQLGGPWAAVVVSGVAPRVYTDAFGHLPLVYSELSAAVSTNPCLLPARIPDHGLRELMDLPRRDNWYPFGLTPWRDVERLLPNHCLDLHSWETVRHWPPPSLGSSSRLALDDVAAVVQHRVTAAIDALTTRYSLQANITAGLDSRMVLACARRHARHVLFITTNGHPLTSPLDLRAGRWLTRRHGLQHEEWCVEPASDAERAEWLLQTGYSTAGADLHEARIKNQYGTTRARITGHGGEIVKGYYATRHAPKANARDYTPEDVIRILALPANRTVAEAAARWLAGLTSIDGETLLQLLYVEQRLACWAGSNRYGGRSSHRVFWPFAHRQILEHTLRLPVSHKAGGAVHMRVIERAWPELLAIPVNAPFGWHVLPWHARLSLHRTRRYVRHGRTVVAKFLGLNRRHAWRA